MIQWKVTIIKMSNGYQVKYSGGDYNENKVYADKSEFRDTPDKDHIVDMFYDIVEYFAEYGSKYDKKRLEITYK